ncbi:hypothetical protein AX16_004445 [Volvariella volvacea WC 439]|nr:hypothetical protein AX16_004445 [Volvariella volvacea WC 439]
MKQSTFLSFLLSFLFTSTLFSYGFSLAVLPNGDEHAHQVQDVDRTNAVLLESVLNALPELELDPEYVSLYTTAEILKNAQRASLGLPPLKPRALRRRERERKGRDKQIHGREEVSDDGQNGGTTMAPFSVPKQFSVGYIAIRQGTVDGPVLGYLSEHKVVPTAQEAAVYAYVQQGEAAEITVLSASFQDTGLHLAVVTGMFGQKLGPELMNYHLSRHSRHSTSANDRPKYWHDEAFTLETAIFLMNPSTNELTVNWINPDGGLPTVEILVSEDRIYYVGDRDAFYRWLGVEAVPIVYQWVEDQAIMEGFS